MNLRTLPVRVLLASCAVVGLTTVSACGGSSSSSTNSPAASSSPSLNAASASASEVSATPSPSASPSVQKKSVTSIGEVKVTGAFGKKPTVKGPFPFAITKTQSKVLVKGDGATVDKSSYVTFNYDLVDATTGKSLQSSFGSAPLTSPVGGLIPGFTESIVGKSVGDRVLMVINSKDAYDSAGGSGDIKVGDTLIFVVDILGASRSVASGDTVKPPAGLPTVTTDAKGYPSVTVDSSKSPPTKLVAQTLVRGDGAKVTAGDNILAHYRMYDWKTGKLLASDYEGAPEEGALGSLLSAWQKGLVGQTVGSRVLIVAPPADAYPNGRATPSIAADTTLVFVIDILYAYQ